MAVKVAVLGGGNGGHAAAADLSNRGFCVHMYEDARFAGNIKKVLIPTKSLWQELPETPPSKSTW